MSVPNVREALKLIGRSTKTTELSKLCAELLKSSTLQIQNVIEKLSQHLINVEDAKLFQKYLSNILLALVSARIPLKHVFSNQKYDTCSDSEKNNHLEFSFILATLSDHPDVLQYALKYFEINSAAPFEVFIHHEDSYNVAPKKRRLIDYKNRVNDTQMVACCYELLNKLPNELAAKWDWTKFVTNFSKHENVEIRWMVKQCMVILGNMTEAQSKILALNLNITDEEHFKIISKRENNNVQICTLSETIKDENLHNSVINIDGILLPVYDKDNLQNGVLVPVKSTVSNLRSLALAVASGQALSLMGPVGSGKTSLVEHLAAITGRKGIAFKKVQLGDQTDSRMLLGGHHCTDVPGEFVWRPGVLTEAVQNGHWLLLEDIDCAALDVASTLSSLLERNTLCVPGYRDALPVTPGFQLFVTQRTLITNFGFQKKLSNSSTLLQKHLTQINVEPLSRSELSEIIQKLYPSLSTICFRMIEVFMMFSVGSHDSSMQSVDQNTEKDNNTNVIRGSRLISTRDLIKWCSRAVVRFNVTSPDSALKVLQDALDIFTCSVSSPENRLELAKKVGTCLGIVETKSEFYCKHYKPNVSLTPLNLEVGRAKVPRVEKNLETIDFDNKQVVFSFTRQSACLLEKISCCVTSNEPVLLVGETGTGKTSSVQYLARQTGHKLIVINMNQQSDSADLLGGYKPVDLKYVIRPIKYEFENLFKSFYNVEKNKKFLGHIETCYDTENWAALLALMKQSYKAATSRLNMEKRERRLQTWLVFGHKLVKLEQQIKAASRLTFAFIEGSLVKAMQEGHWVLLDEINLASAEILECLAGLLEDKNESIDLLEKGDKIPIKRHPDFTLFACMNPATDVGKKDLPVGLRNRFTEFFIDELTERNDLMLLIGDYLYHMNLGGAILEAIYIFYASIRKEAKLSLVDGAGNAPHYSLRTLCRALIAAAKAKCGTVARSLYEAFCLSFLTQLDSSSHPVVEAMIAKAVIGKKHLKSVLNQLIPEPQVLGQNYLLFEGHWIPQGKLEINIPEGYILTPTVRKNLRDIARIISLGILPVLLQGDTSVGKTSLITYIAKASGNYCVRINNHEHTDLQEYIGSYATDASGKLVFREGVLVEAMRKGYWIILDELNLAPSDVLEALNRVLDDNRELYIPETQQVVKADSNFMLFATQNPPGLYGGRKMLSRAFRNRFVELHFDEIPKKELEIILHQRCHVPPAYSKKMISVMADLQIRRRGSAAVQGKDGFITLRDLFRWGQRYKQASKETLTDDKFYDWDQHIADEGYLVLAGKVRQPDERSIIEEVIEKHIKRKVSPDNLFSLHRTTSPVTKHVLELLLNNQLKEFSHVVWTYNMRRLAVLIAKSFAFNEPVLLVGETGCGKTTICQVLAALKKRQLLSVNCHMHTESSDFLGGLRPVRQYKGDGRLFEWVDGPLIKAMESGDMFLADEISLADDSVLERLNSLLEPERQLVLAERGMEDNADIVVITAEENFHFIGTMNPGGDFGKKELSPALRNRFTEIWCDSCTSREDLLRVLEKSVSKGITLNKQEDESSGIGNSILDFTDWLKNSEVTNKFPFSIRDLLSWVQFINTTVAKGLLDTSEAYVHGACMTFLDCFGTALTGHVDSETLVILRKTAINFLLDQIKSVGSKYTEQLKEMLSNKQRIFVAENDDTKFGITPFYIGVSPNKDISEDSQQFTFTAPTTGSNTLRILRGMQLNKAILLEGNPGVGKTSLVTALAKSSGHRVVRINLSDQTDITDLFGTDLPTEDGSFTFKEGAFLNALHNGDWILLDELNLAPQPVLEGLNACLDHRGEVFIPELGKTFKVKQETKLFACQNPLKQGGARRGLPLSFLNRFTQVYIDTLTKADLIYIVESQYPIISKDILHRIVKFNCKVAYEVTQLQSWAHRGAPWEMNLRDIQRWCEAIIDDLKEGKEACPGKFVDMLYVNRMRTAEDKERMIRTYEKYFIPEYPRSHSNPLLQINDQNITLGDVSLLRHFDKNFKNHRVLQDNLLLLRSHMPILKALAQTIKMNWLTILVGPTATGKSSAVQVLADLTGNDLQVVPVTSAMDVSDLLGGFEQVDYNRSLENLYDKIETLTMRTVRSIWISKDDKKWKTKLLSSLREYKSLHVIVEDSNSMTKFEARIRLLVEHCKKLLEHNVPYSDNASKLKAILHGLEKLETKVSGATAVNAGGKFEWVDSLLVKTMIEGSWLLLDNVNLTSAAVLDRLNGLLEPNGVLSIPERGDMSEIRPHPNFRVFFTMDPKYGEISRAMRNRGVEIYLLRPDDLNAKLTETVTNMDLKAMLASCGLPCHYHETFIECHELMVSYVQGFERPTISHLLQAAHLSWQQIVRGISEKIAIINSFSDVYIKPRCGADFTNNNMSLSVTKKAMLNALDQKLDTVKFEFNGVKDTAHTLAVKGLQANSTIETIRQIAVIAIQEALQSPSRPNYLHTLFGVFNAYLNTPKSELLDMYYNVIDTALKKGSQDDRLIRFTIALNEVSLFVLSSNFDFNCYKRFYPEVYKLNEDYTKVNSQTVLYFYFLLNEFLNKIIKVSKSSAINYSTEIMTGKLTDIFPEYPILMFCTNYLNSINDVIKEAIKNADSLDDEFTCKLFQLLNWVNRFKKLASEDMFLAGPDKKQPQLKEDLVTLLYVHSKWLEKHLITPLFRLSNNIQLERDFYESAKKISPLGVQSSDLAKVSKRLRKLHGQPKLYESKEEYDLCLKKNEIFSKLTLNINQPVPNQVKVLTTNPSQVSDHTLALDVPDHTKLSIIEENISKMSPMTPAIVTEIKLLPLTAYVTQRVLDILKIGYLDFVTKITSEEKQPINENDLNIWLSFVHLVKQNKGFPVAFMNVIDLIIKVVKGDVQNERLSSLPSKFWDEFYKAMVFSPAFYPYLFLTFTNEETTSDNVPSSSKRLSRNLPLMLYYVQNLTLSIHNSTVDECQQHIGGRPQLAYETVSLENSSMYSIQLSSILNMIWKNIATLDYSAEVKAITDAKFEVKKYEHLIHCLHSIVVKDGSIVFSNTLTDDIFKTVKHDFEASKEVTPYIEKSHEIYSVLTTDIRVRDINTTKVKILTAELSLITSVLFAKILTEVNPVDHVERYRLKVQYIKEDIEMFEAMLSDYYFYGLVKGTITDTRNIEKPSDVNFEFYKCEEVRNDLKKVHPYCSVILDLKEQTADSVHKYALGNTFRPENVSYTKFAKDCKYFKQSLLSDTFSTLTESLISTCELLYQQLQNPRPNKTLLSTCNTNVVRANSWLYSVNAFYKKIESDYSEAFPDLAKPLQSSLSHIVYSITSMNDLIKEMAFKLEQELPFDKLVEDLIVYPNVLPQRGMKEQFLNRFIRPEFNRFLNKKLSCQCSDGSIAEAERIEILKMNLTELRMHCTAKENVDKVTINAVLSTLRELVKVWDRQQQLIEQKKQDDEALYVTKSKCEDEDEDAQFEQEVQEMFPSYSDQDFSDFKPATLEQKPIKKPQNKNPNIKHLISPDDISLVFKWHSNFVKTMTSAEWLPSKKKLVGNDVISSFLQRYPTSSQIIGNSWEALDAKLEGTVSPSLMVLVSQIKAKLDGKETSSKVDFYRSAWVSETRQCLPLLQKVKDATNELLDQWPDFPTLKEIIQIVDRILNFPVTSPVSRFLTGLELLRDKIEEWNKNAHKGNNMIDVSLAVGQQIINWRKLEMAHWKECLNNLYQRKLSEAHKYWFFLYAVINSYLVEQIPEDPVSPERVVGVLKDFMEKCNLVEYEVRLEVIYVYHCHLVHLEPSQRRDELLSILWNIHNYYAQFAPQVSSYVKEKRAPIEKKLRDFVKICTWDRDLSYWSVKDTVEKAHKALHKHTKEFEKLLKESVQSCLVDNSTESTVDHVGIWDRPKRATTNAPAGGAYMIDPTNYVVLARNVKKFLDETEEPSSLINENSLLSKVGNLLNKAKILCKDTITNTGYPSLVQALDDFVTLVIETNTHLGSLEIDASQPKEKQKSQAKSIIQQKRKALADLFKYLAKMGLNYRTGLVILAAANDNLYDFTIPPVDLEAAMGYLKTRRCDASLSLLWLGCEKYFQKNIARHRLLSTALLTPHQDLGMQNIERCKGFAAQLLQLTNTQKKSISKYSRRLCELRNLTTHITNALEIDTDTNIATLNRKLDILSDCYANTSIVLEQFNVVLKSLPEKEISPEYEPNFDSVLSDSKIVKCYKNTDEWKDLNKRIKALITNVDKQKNALNKVVNNVPKKIGDYNDVPIVSQNHMDVAIDTKNNLETLIANIDGVLNEYSLKLKLDTTETEPNHPLLRSIVQLSSYLKETLNAIEKLDTENEVSMEASSGDIITQSEDLVATMLLIIQSVYKKHLPPVNESLELITAIDEIIQNGEKVEETKDLLEDKHLKDLLHDKLITDSKALQLKALISKLENLLKNYVQYVVGNKNVDEVKSVVMRLVPILEQTVLFVQYFVTQEVAVHRVSCKMLSILLKIFSDLATKGFCKPSDLDMDGEGEGGPGKLTGGTGLGDGEGQTDVSERIENEDQLDDAQRPGEEKKDEEKDCKEEEKGINMTDDFDSHLQDVDKKDGENSDEEDNDNDDADKQMGDIDNAAEKLDQQIWGSEDEEEVEEGKKENEDRGKGESTGEKEVAAKEKEQEVDDGSEGKDKKQKKDINEMEEPEVDDDHVDPYHGKEQHLPEPEDFELPDNMDMDGEEQDIEEDKEGETETENPFEIDKMTDMTDEPTDDKQDKEENRNGLDVSSDEEDGNEAGSEEAKDGVEKDGDDKDKDEDAAQPDTTEDNDEPINDDNPEITENEPESEQTPEKDNNEDLPKNNEDITDEDNQEQKNHEANPQANPSNDDPSAQDRAENAQMDQGTNDNVEMNAEQAKDEEAAPYEQAQEQVGEEKQSTGRSELDKSDKGHRGEKQAAKRTDSNKQKDDKRDNKPGKTDDLRTLGDINEQKQKKSHTLNVEREDDVEDGGDPESEEKDADAYQHVKQAKRDDLQAIDAATKEQAEQQPTIQKDDEDDAESLKEDEQVPMDVDEDDIQVDKSEELKPEKTKDGKEKDNDKSGSKKEKGDEPTGDTGVEVEGDKVLTENIPRGTDTTYHTRLDNTTSQTEDLSVQEYMSIREYLVHKPGSVPSSGVWRSLWQQSAGSARALCERLRLVLEPTLSSRRAGDFRTGRAINMRRVIPYIASHFRKDRIWLRRTKPAKREYKIAIAVDDSSSMSDNRSKELAFESLALVSQALNLLESGDLAVLSYGENPNLLHPFTEQFSEHSGSKILEHLTFNQTKTKIAQLLDFCTVLFDEQSIRSDALNAKLLVIVGDGRNIFAEGETKVIQAVRRARQQGIFLVYVVIDNPDNRDSIMDIRKPVMDTVTNKLSFISYLDAFPFPFYLILRDMTALPNVLGDALRQWFELAANTS